MSKISEQKALEAYPIINPPYNTNIEAETNVKRAFNREGYIKGYDQAMQDIEKQVEESIIEKSNGEVTIEDLVAYNQGFKIGRELTFQDFMKKACEYWSTIPDDTYGFNPCKIYVEQFKKYIQNYYQCEFCNYKWTTAMEGGRLIHTGQPWMWYDSDAVYVDNGTAELLAYREYNTIHHWDGKTYHPTVACGLLRSVDTFGYGTFSAEIQLPKGKNLWPAFWLVGEGKKDWPADGEIDIMEAWTNRFGGYFKMGIPQPPYLVPSWNTTTNIHWQEYDGRHGYTGSRRLPLLFSLKRPEHNFIKYEVEWRQDIITFRVNGKRVRTYGYHVAKHLHDKKMHVIFDLWTTGENFSCISPMKIRNFEFKPLKIL